MVINMKLSSKLLSIFLFMVTAAFSQDLKTKNIIIVTLDGYRWQEIFKGADPGLISNQKYSKDKSLLESFNASDLKGRREQLMPFFWNVIGKRGQLYGNRTLGSKVNCANHHLISYPGYSEMLVGFDDKKVSSNRKKINPNPTVLEFIQGHKDFHNKVAAFATWDAFPYILRKDKVDFHVNAGLDIAQGELSDKEKEINTLLTENQVRHDQYTFHYAFEYMKRVRPRVMFLSFDDTDKYSHAGEYDKYLNAAHEGDKMIGQIWEWVQSQPDYKDQTTILITTDHGRGRGKNNWRNHRLLATGSRQIWFAVMGPDTPSSGELSIRGKYYQKQVAKTIASFLGIQYAPAKPVGDVVQTMLVVPQPLKADIFIGQSEGVNNK